MKVMTYNIHSAIGTDDVPDAGRIADIIRSAAPDIVGVEEVSVNHFRYPGVDQAAAIGEAVGMHRFFGESMPLYDGDGIYGLMVLARDKFEIVGRYRLPTPPGEEPRIFIVVKVLTDTPYYFIVTHFSYQGEFVGDEEYQLASARLITEKVRENQWLPAVWVGDFNTHCRTEVMRYVHEHWLVANDLDPDTPTVDTEKYGPLQIDFICAMPKDAFVVESLELIPDQLASDHKPVVAVLRRV